MRVTSFGTLINSSLLTRDAELPFLGLSASQNDFSAGGKNVGSEDSDRLMLDKYYSGIHSQKVMLERYKEVDLQKEFDLIIIGGGINGCGIARDAAERGLKVLLLEKEDFGSGCSSAATRIIHGGLRYLEHLELYLVRESLRERELLLKNASHLVKPLEFCLPVYKDDKRGYWLIKLGMLAYDLLSFDKSLPWHRMLSYDDFALYEPEVNHEGLIGAAVYYDAQVTFPERICIENIIMAKNAGAIPINHAEVVGVQLSGDKVSAVNFIDNLTDKRHSVRGKVVINVSGPWVDEMLGLTERHLKKQIGGTKGSHIVVKRFPNGPRHALYVSAKSDGRPFFIIPWQSYYLIGTTDIPYSGDLDKVSATNEEVDYLIKETNRVLSSVQITKEDILFTYAGIRPLPFLGSANPAATTRRHIIFDHSNEGISNFLSIIGGKLTTYRNLSEQVTDKTLTKLNYDFVRSKTRKVPLIGNPNEGIEGFKEKYSEELKRRYQIDDETISNLINIYGKRCLEVLKVVERNKMFSKHLSSHSPDIGAQIAFAVESEMAYTVSDVLLRRTSLGLNNNLGIEAINDVAGILGNYLQLSTSEVEKQIREYEERVVKLRIAFKN